MKVHVLKIKIDSLAEEYFVNDLMPICKDKVKVRLGAIFGMPWNEYEITDGDYNIIAKFLKQKKRGR